MDPLKMYFLQKNGDIPASYVSVLPVPGTSIHLFPLEQLAVTFSRLYYLTGHSLGGGIAKLVDPWMRNRTF